MNGRRGLPTTRDRGQLKEVFRRVTITGFGDGSLRIVDAIDDIRAQLYALQNETDDPQVVAALRAATGDIWRASVLHRVAKNNDIRMVAETDYGTTSAFDPDTVTYERERGDARSETSRVTRLASTGRLETSRLPYPSLENEKTSGRRWEGDARRLSPRWGVDR